MFKQALLGYEKASLLEHPENFRVCLYLGKLYLGNAKLAEAETLLKKALNGYESQSFDNIFMFVAIQNLGLLYHCRRELDNAEIMFKRALAGYEKTPRLESLDRIRAVEALGVILHHCKKYKEAETMLKKH